MNKLFIFFTGYLKKQFGEFLYFCGFLKNIFSELFLLPQKKIIEFNVISRQVLFTGFEALKIINIIGLTIGAVIIIQGITLLENFGQTTIGYKILIMVITKELGPLLTAFIVLSRSGTSISTELGNMVVNHEVEALVSFGINPIGYLVVPRVIGVVAAIFSLTIYFNIAGLFGGYFVSAMIQPMPFTIFLNNLLQNLTIKDIIVSLTKSLVFGFVISIISCYHGLKVKYASTEVPVRTIKAVVSNLTWIFIFNLIITVISYNI